MTERVLLVKIDTPSDTCMCQRGEGRCLHLSPYASRGRWCSLFKKQIPCGFADCPPRLPECLNAEVKV